jgi:flagellar motor switch/type III secretory pathway protein FliN
VKENEIQYDEDFEEFDEIEDELNDEFSEEDIEDENDDEVEEEFDEEFDEENDQVFENNSQQQDEDDYDDTEEYLSDNIALEPQPNNISNIDIPIMVVVGTLKISLRKLQSLKSGDVLNLDKWNQIVKLYIQEQVIAEGVLVDVGGIIGVKLTNKSSNS